MTDRSHAKRTNTAIGIGGVLFCAITLLAAGVPATSAAAFRSMPRRQAAGQGSVPVCVSNSGSALIRPSAEFAPAPLTLRGQCKPGPTTLEGEVPAGLLRPQHSSAGSPASTDQCPTGTSVSDTCPAWAHVPWQPNSPPYFVMPIALLAGSAGAYVAGLEPTEDGSEWQGFLALYNSQGQVWKEAFRSDTWFAAALSPDESTVYVSGAYGPDSPSCGGPSNQFVAAYDAASGALMWESMDDGCFLSTQLAVSSDGRRLYVADDRPLRLIAYDATTGAREWSLSVPLPSSYFFDQPWPQTGVTVRGDMVYLTTLRVNKEGSAHFGLYPWTTAVSAIRDEAAGPAGEERGVFLWNATLGRDTYPALTRSIVATPTTVAVVAESGFVYLTNENADLGGGCAYDDSRWKVVGLDPGTGATMWTNLVGSGKRNMPASIAASPDGRHIYVTGNTSNPATDSDIDGAGKCIMREQTTVSYDAATGAEEWSTTESPPPGFEEAYGGLFTQDGDVVASPDGGTVYATGATFPAWPTKKSSAVPGFVHTVAYDAATGAREWNSRWDAQGPSGAATVPQCFGWYAAAPPTPGSPQVYTLAWCRAVGPDTQYISDALTAAAVLAYDV